MRVPIVDLKVQYNSIKEEVDAAIQNVIQSGQFILGPEVSTFEEKMAAYCGTKYAIGVASGTDALKLALIACGIQPGDEVITTPFTFAATVEVIVQCGAIPVFVDINPRTFNIDPDKIDKRVTPRTRAIIPVHLYGQPADMDPITEIARKYNLKVIEDCAQSLGAEYKGRKTGSIGDTGCFSFFPSKNLGAYGDGGMVVSGNPEITEMVSSLRKHGAQKGYYYELIGYNSRLDALQAAILNVKLRRIDEWVELRRQKASLYEWLLSEIDGIEPPHIEKYAKSSFNYYTIRIKDSNLNRKNLKNHLVTRGIQTMIYYPLSLHLQRAYNFLGYKEGDFPESEKAQEEVISLPIYPELREEQMQEVVQSIGEFVKSHERMALKVTS